MRWKTTAGRDHSVATHASEAFRGSTGAPLSPISPGAAARNQAEEWLHGRLWRPCEGQTVRGVVCPFGH